MTSKKLTLTSLILMIFTSVFGFANIPKAYYLMGYASIPWYILAALTFFLPFAFMLAEFGAAFKDSKGGIYSWMAQSIGPKFAFVGTFMWYASYIILMVNVASGIWIPLSNFIFGVDKTQSWHLFGLNGVQTLGILAFIWILLITFISSKGLDKIKKVTSVGGIAVTLLNVLLLIGGLIILVLNGGEMLQPVSVKAFITSPNDSYQSVIAVFSFLVFAIFAYGGIEAIGGLVDQTERADVTFPRAVTISAIVIAVGYALGIFIVGSFTNWAFTFTQFSQAETTLGNVAYITMNNMGYQFGLALNLSDTTSMTIGNWFSRYMGLSMFLASTGSFFTLMFSPLKQLIEGTPKEIWPKKWTIIKNDMPIYAMWIQALIICLIIAFVSFGGDNAKKFFQVLTAMTNVSITIPNMFLAIAFIGFKNKKEIIKPFEMYKSKRKATAAAYMVLFVVGFANIFTIINPAINGNLSETIWSIVGPLFFSLVALALFANYEKKQKNEL